MLEGVRVLDLTRLLPGPYATQILLELGAQVDKCEDPRAGDYLRLMPPHASDSHMNVTFVALNRGKRSIVLDLKDERGKEAFRRLVCGYDVLVEGFRPGVMESLGLGPDTLRSLHPRLVYCSISGYGQDGPLRDRAGHDLNYLARAGVLGLSGPPAGPPAVPPVQIADLAGGGQRAVIAILAALIGRGDDGEGREIDVSMCEGAMALAAFGLTTSLAGWDSRFGQGGLAGGVAVYGTYRTKDGRYVALACLEPKFWARFCDGVGLDPDPQALVPGPHQREWAEKIGAVIGTGTRSEWEAFNDAHDCCLEPVWEPQELASDPQHRHRGIRVQGQLGFTPFGPAKGEAPMHGQHTSEILAEVGAL